MKSPITTTGHAAPRALMDPDEPGFPPHLQISYTKLQSHRGKPRLWLEGIRLEACGFAPGARFSVSLDLVSRQVRLRVDPAGDRSVAVRRRAFEDGVRETSIIDFASSELSDVLGEGARVRAVFRAGELVFDLHPEERARQERESRTRAHLAEGFLTKATLCAGAGVSTLALADGLESRGLETRVDWIIDREGAYLDLATRNNSAITPETRIYEASLEEVDTQALSSADVLSFGLPCTGHSLSGKAKRKLTHAEEHPTDALAVYGALRIMEAVNPTVVVSENVVQARESASYAIIRAYLVAKGYEISEAILDNAQAGSLESRTRWWMCAISKGMAAGFTMADVPSQPRKYETLGSAMEDVPADHPSWRSYDYLTAKAARDLAEGKGFKRSMVGPDSMSVGCVTRGYAKARSTDPFILREDGLQRLMTPIEHARVKGIPPELVKQSSVTTAHEALGQSILYGHAVGIGELLAEHFLPLTPIERLPIYQVGERPEDNESAVPGMGA